MRLCFIPVCQLLFSPVESYWRI